MNVLFVMKQLHINNLLFMQIVNMAIASTLNVLVNVRHCVHYVGLLYMIKSLQLIIYTILSAIDQNTFTKLIKKVVLKTNVILFSTFF